MARWSDIDRTLDMMDEMRRRMDWIFTEPERGRTRPAFRALFDDAERPARAPSAWPAVNLFDTGNSLVLEADVPGLSDKELYLSVQDDVLTLKGERKSDAPQGYAAHRRERAPIQFARSFALPCRVDFEKTSATVKDGVLTVTMAKAPEAQPRQIQVQAK